MAAVTPTLTYAGEFAGDTRIAQITATATAASDTITLTAASCGGLTSIVGVVGYVITGGLDNLFTSLQIAVSGLVITVTSFGEAGTAATDFTGTTYTITLLIKTTAAS